MLAEWFSVYSRGENRGFIVTQIASSPHLHNHSIYAESQQAADHSSRDFQMEKDRVIRLSGHAC